MIKLRDQDDFGYSVSDSILNPLIHKDKTLLSEPTPLSKKIMQCVESLQYPKYFYFNF